MIQQSAPLVHLDIIVFGCCGWGGRNVIDSSNVDDIGGGKALGGENNNQQTTRERVVMATGGLRGDDNASNVRPHPPNTQQPAIGRGWGGGNKDDKEEEYSGCWRMVGKVASAPETRRRGVQLRRALGLQCPYYSPLWYLLPRLVYRYPSQSPLSLLCPLLHLWDPWMMATWWTRRGRQRSHVMRG